MPLFSTKSDVFFDRSTLTLVSLELLGVQRHTVAHFKGLINVKVDLEAQGRDTSFIMGHALLKKATLHL